MKVKKQNLEKFNLKEIKYSQMLKNILGKVFKSNKTKKEKKDKK